MKTVLITGANRGLGEALCLCFADAGWHVIATARNINLLKEKPNVTYLELDLSNYDSIQALSNTIQTEGYKIEFLINNAGYNPKDSQDKAYFQSTFKIESFSGKNVEKSLQINALAPIELVSKLLPQLTETAAVLNISSWLGSIEQKTKGGHYGYAGSKALLNMFTKAMALEFADGERCAVAFNPGWMKTDMGGSNGKFAPKQVAHEIKYLYSSGALHKNNGEFLNADGSKHSW